MNTQDREQLLTRMEDLLRKAQKTGMAHSKFLTPSEAAEIERAYASRQDINLLTEGGLDDAERKIAVFLQPDWGAYAQEEVLAALALSYRPQDTVRHQDVLGAVLALGLSRDVLGDILIEPGRACLICLNPMCDYIADRIEKLGRIGVSVERIKLSDLPHVTGSLTQKQITIASLRLDALIAAAFHLSRNDANELILSGLVQLDHQQCLNTSKAVVQDAIISVRGKGRLKLLNVLNETKKGRLRINLGFY